MYNGMFQRLPHNKQQHQLYAPISTASSSSSSSSRGMTQYHMNGHNSHGTTHTTSQQHQQQQMNGNDTTTTTSLAVQNECDNHDRLCPCNFTTTSSNGRQLQQPCTYRCSCCWSPFTTGKILLVSPFIFLIIVLCVYMVQRMLSFHSQNVVWVHPSYHFLERTCPHPNYYTYTDYNTNNQRRQQLQHDGTSTTTTRTTDQTTKTATKPKICITTLTDERKKSFVNKILGWRNFDGIMELTWENKVRYAKKHSYTVFDESHVVNGTRGPSWFKIIAVQRLLREEQCDWVFWMDADMVIMNSTIRIEDFLPYYDDDDNSNNNDITADSDDAVFKAPKNQPQYDLLLSTDIRQSNHPPPINANNGTKYVGNSNAGAWIIRNSDWSMDFLTTWWNMKSYVQPIGHSFSGDNHALKDLLRDVPNIDRHGLVPSTCTFNAFAKFIRENMDATKRQQLIHDRTNHEAYYHKGDFVAHVAGTDNKRDTIKMLLELAV